MSYAERMNEARSWAYHNLVPYTYSWNEIDNMQDDDLWQLVEAHRLVEVLD